MEDERLAAIQAEKDKALQKSNDTYNSILADNQNLYDQSNKYLEEQQKIQNSVLDKQLDATRTEIDKQKKEAQANYDTESKRALNDYTSYNNPYGYEAESMASNGLLNSGVSETSKLGSFNTYQNRLATANKVMQDAFTTFDSDLNAAILNNDVKKAEYALQKLQMQQSLLSDFYANKSNTMQSQLQYNQNLDNNYYNRYQNEYQNIQNEKATQEAIRQYEQNLAYQRERDAVADSQWQKEYNLSQQKINASSGSNGGSSGGSSSNNTGIVLGDNESVVTDANGKQQVVNNSSKPKDYLMSNGYQPRYVLDSNGKYSKLEQTGKFAKEVFDDLKGSNLGDYRIWTTNGKYYMFDMKSKDYIDITKQYKDIIVNKKNVNWSFYR